jgi:uroporphyrinogen-III synthase
MPDQTLKNKVIISSRPKGRSDELQKFLNDRGAEMLEFPLIEIKKRELTQNGSKVLKAVDCYDWLIFTSVNGVRFFFTMYNELTDSTRLPKSIKTAVVGSKTATALMQYGYPPDYVNTGITGADLAKQLEEQLEPSKAIVLFPCGNLADNTIPDALAGRARVDKVVVYDTTMPSRVDDDILQRLLTDNYDLLVVTSPSCFYNLETILADHVVKSKLRVVSIGPATSRVLHDHGTEPVVTAMTASSKGIVDAIIDYYNLTK